MSDMAKTVNGIFEKIITFDALYAAYIRARKGKRRSRACLLFEKDLEGELIQIQNQLIWSEYRTGPYRSFYVNEPKHRKITALSHFRDRVVQQAIHAEIEPIYERRFIATSFACRPDKGTHAGANKAQKMLQDCLREHGKIYALKADISRYFASIDHAILKRLLRKKIGDKRVLQLLDEIIDSYSEDGTPGKGLPIGNLTSQLFANIYLDHFDQWIKCHRQERWYVRYMDDWVVIHPCKQHLGALRIDAERFLQDELHLSTNHKTQIFPVAHSEGRGLDFLGYHLWPDRRRLRKASLKRFKRRVRTLQRQYAEGRIEMADIHQQLHSWVAHARHGDATPAVEAVLSNTIFKRADA